MTKFFARLGSMILFSRKRRCVRKGVIFLCTNFLLIAGFIFGIEVIVVMLGVVSVYLPLTNETVRFLTRFFF
jgi:hypothetical protein